MRTKVVLTVDTEPSIAGAFVDPEKNTPLLHEPVAGEVGGRSEALGFLIRTLNAHNLVATFFVETVHTTYFPPSEMGQYAEKLMAAGQDVQLHLHPGWLSFENGRLQPGVKITDNCSELEKARLVEIMKQGCAQIQSWTGTAPTGMRTGNFATAMPVFPAMVEAGLTNSSNICLAVCPPPEPELAIPSGVHDFSGITELPVTCFTDNGPVGRGKLRPMQITALRANEQIALLNQLHARGDRVAVIVTHPFEFLKKDDFRYRNLKPNRVVQKRFEKLCAYLAANTDKFEVVALANAATLPKSPAPEPPMKGNAVRATIRAVENFMNDRF